jgi:hypothetical protein
MMDTPNFLNNTIQTIINSTIANTIANFFKIKISKPPEPISKFLMGDWISTWESKPGDNNWIVEDIQISLEANDKLKFFSKNSASRYSYEGDLNMVKNSLFGSWRSTQDGNNGVFLLIMTENKKRLYGFITATDRHEQLKFKKYILGKIVSNSSTDEARADAEVFLEDGKGFIADSLKPTNRQ